MSVRSCILAAMHDDDQLTEAERDELAGRIEAMQDVSTAAVVVTIAEDRLAAHLSARTASVHTFGDTFANGDELATALRELADDLDGMPSQ